MPCFVLYLINIFTRSRKAEREMHRYYVKVGLLLFVCYYGGSKFIATI